MNFADELRNNNADEEKKRMIKVNLDKDVPLFTGLLKQACI